MNKRSQPIDWAAIEKDYRFGSMSNVALAEWYSVSEAAIRKRAKQGNWVRGGATPAGGDAIATVATPHTTSPEAIIGRGRNLTLRLLDELDATTSRVGELQEMVDAALDGQDSEKQRQAVEHALSLKNRADVLKALALTAKTLLEASAPDGKKAQRQAEAEKVAEGKFAPRGRPRLAVNNT